MNKNVTYRELAEWLAKGNGEWKHEPSHSGVVYTTFKYLENEADKKITVNNCGQSILVRRFGENVWHSPTKDYFEKEKQNER